ncbi:MAG: ABC transporter permease [Alphaproteobacteria bacterium]|nr:ABC transporter permease [Alphaproteobacteria bacterium]
MNRFFRDPLAWLGIILLMPLILGAVFGPLMADAALQTHLSARLLPPSADHWFGTDALGRDVLARTLAGARQTLGLAVLVAGLAAPLGLLIGALAGTLGGWIETVLMRMTDIALSVPRLILALALAAALGPGLVNAAIAVALTAWPPYARQARAETLSARKADFIAAARLCGASELRVACIHIVPLGLSSMLVRLSLDLAGIVLTAAGLGFLGLGAQPPAPEWGAMVAAGRTHLIEAPWVAGFPGLAILMAGLGFSLIGDALRDALDPRSDRC